MSGSDKVPQRRRASTAHVPPLADEELANAQDVVDLARSFTGHVPTSFRIMARKPAILRTFVRLVAAVMREPGEVPAEFKWLVAHAVSAGAGCRYCQVHTAANSTKAGLPVAKVEAMMEYETNTAYSELERAAIAVALAAGQAPNAATREHCAAPRAHLSESAIVEIVAVISLFGWLSRWNDTLASDLEPAPLNFASAHLRPTGWSPGKHASS